MKRSDLELLAAFTAQQHEQLNAMSDPKMLAEMKVMGLETPSPAQMALAARTIEVLEEVVLIIDAAFDGKPLKSKPETFGNEAELEIA
jgi:hypothetical protein